MREESSRLDWMRAETRAYTCLSLIAGSSNWTVYELVSMAKQGIRKK